MMINKLLPILIAGLLILSCASSMDSANEGGNSSEVVIGLVVDSVGAPVAHAVVSLYPHDYNPVTDGGAGKLTDTSDENGNYRFELVSPETYSIVCEDVGNGGVQRGAISVYQASHDADTTFDTLELQPMVAKTIAVPDSLVDTVGGYLYMSGTDYSVPVSEAEKAGGYYNFTFTAVPQGEIASVNVSSTEDPEDDVVVEEEVKTYEPIWYQVHSSGLDSLNNVTRITQDSSGAMWFAGGSNLFRLQEFSNWTVLDTVTGVHSGKIFGLAADMDKGVWITDSTGRIHWYDGISWNTFDSTDWDRIRGAYAVAAVSPDTMVFGDKEGNRGVYIYEKSKNAWTVLDSGNGGASKVLALDCQDGEIWSLHDLGCAWYQGVPQNWDSYNIASMGQLAASPENIDILPNVGVWFASAAGLSFYDYNSWEYIDTGNSGIHAADHFEIDHDAEGRLYVTTSKGLASLYGDVWKEHSGDAGTPPPVDNPLYSTTVDRDGNIWVGGAAAGVYVMGPTAKQYGN